MALRPSSKYPPNLVRSFPKTRHTVGEVGSAQVYARFALSCGRTTEMAIQSPRDPFRT